MTRYIDVFNGDADGLCALIQWRRVFPESSTRVSGVKRDNALLKKVDAGSGDKILVLDITFDNNRKDVERLLAAGVSMDYFDHHFPGERISHPNLRLTIDESPSVCTSLLVNAALDGKQSDWAITGAFGDNLKKEATALAQTLGVAPEKMAQLAQLGELLNYNGYGSELSDLHFDPVDLYAKLYEYGTPQAFISDAPEFRKLADGYASDMAQADSAAPLAQSATTAAYQLPDAPWARRAIGVWANTLSQANPERAHMIFVPDGKGTLTASLRTSRTNPNGAADFCRRFPNGGGRASAAGITALAPASVDDVVKQFIETF